MKHFILVCLIVTGCCSDLIMSEYGYAQVHERWDVKTLTDGFLPRFENPKPTTVKEIEDIDPSPFRNDQARYEFEKVVVILTGIVRHDTKCNSPEADGDLHIEIQDESSTSIAVCESVDPANDITKGSSSIALFDNVRLIACNLKEGDSVRVTGLLFQDKKHGKPTMRTNNFVEIHPILVMFVLPHSVLRR